MTDEGIKNEPNKSVPSSSPSGDKLDIKSVKTSGPDNVRAKAVKGGIELEIDTPDLQSAMKQAAVAALQQNAQKIGQQAGAIGPTDDTTPDTTEPNTPTPPPLPPILEDNKIDGRDASDDGADEEPAEDETPDKRPADQLSPTQNEQKPSDGAVDPNATADQKPPIDGPKTNTDETGKPIPEKSDRNGPKPEEQKNATPPPAQTPGISSTTPPPTPPKPADQIQTANQMKENNNRKRKASFGAGIKNFVQNRLPQPPRTQSENNPNGEYNMGQMRQAADVLNIVRSRKRKLAKRADDITKAINKLRSGSDKINRSRGMNILRLLFPGIASRIEGMLEFKPEKNQIKLVKKLDNAIAKSKTNIALLGTLILPLTAVIDALWGIIQKIPPTFGFILLISPILLLTNTPAHYFMGGTFSTPVHELIKDLRFRLEILQEIYKRENKILQLMMRRNAVRDEMRNPGQGQNETPGQPNGANGPNPENNQAANDDTEKTKPQTDYAEAA